MGKGYGSITESCTGGIADYLVIPMLCMQLLIATGYQK